MKRLLLVFFAVLCCCASVFGQTLTRFGPYEFPSVSNSSPPFLVANLSPNQPTLAVCNSPANQVPCTNYATTYQFNGTPCATGSQDTPDPNATTAACQSTGDAEGNIAFWAPPGQYDITVCIQNNCFLYTVANFSLPSSAGFASLSAALSSCNPSLLITTSLAVPSNTTVPSTCTLQFMLGGNLNVSSGATATINGPVFAPATQIFKGSGTVVFGSSVTQGPVEWFGAVGDWNGSTGTDNTAAIQACITAFTAGNCSFLGKGYKTTSALSITHSSVGLIGVGTSSTASVFATTPPSSQIVQTCASCDIVDIAGSNSTNGNLGYNQIRNLRLSRSVLPTGSAHGLSVTYAYGTIVDYVESEDSFYDFYFKGVGSGGVGYIENCQALWGDNGITETSGDYYGFTIDSAGGIGSPSLRIRNVATTTGVTSGVQTIGIYATGSLLSDLHLIHPESYLLNYGIYLAATSGAFTSSSDIQIVDPINDSCSISCFYINAIAGTVSVTGGWDYCTGACTVAASITGSDYVTFTNHVFYSLGSGQIFYALNDDYLSLTSSRLIGGTGAAVYYSGVVGGVISGNTILVGGSIDGIQVVNSSDLAISSNVLSSGTTLATGIAIDGSSHFITGIETNTCTNLVTTCTSDAGGNYIQKLEVAFASLPSCTSALAGAWYPVKDANTSTFNATITAGSSTNHGIAYCNGTNWVFH